MNKCRMCKWSGRSEHDEACPKAATSAAEESRRQKIFDQGETDGRQGRQKTSVDATYRLGYSLGNCALEEVENGFDPRFDIA